MTNLAQSGEEFLEILGKNKWFNFIHDEDKPGSDGNLGNRRRKKVLEQFYSDERKEVCV